MNSRYSLNVCSFYSQLAIAREMPSSRSREKLRRKLRLGIMLLRWMSPCRHTSTWCNNSLERNIDLGLIPPIVDLQLHPKAEVDIITSPASVRSPSISHSFLCNFTGCSYGVLKRKKSPSFKKSMNYESQVPRFRTYHTSHHGSKMKRKLLTPREHGVVSHTHYSISSTHVRAHFLTPQTQNFSNYTLSYLEHYRSSLRT